MSGERELLRYRGHVVATLHREGDIYRLKPTCLAPLFDLERLWADPECARQAVREACEAAERANAAMPGPEAA